MVKRGSEQLRFHDSFNHWYCPIGLMLSSLAQEADTIMNAKQILV